MISICKRIDNILKLGEQKLKNSSINEILYLIKTDLIELSKNIGINGDSDYYKLLKLSLIYKDEKYLREINFLTKEQLLDFDFILTYDQLSSVQFVFYPYIEEIKNVERILFGYNCRE